MTEHVHSWHMGQCTPCLLAQIAELEAELAIWRQCHSAPKPGECQPIFDRAGRCGTCTACGKNFTCGAKLGYPTDKATARERLSQFVPSVECAVDERLDRVERELSLGEWPKGTKTVRSIAAPDEIQFVAMPAQPPGDE